MHQSHSDSRSSALTFHAMYIARTVGMGIEKSRLKQAFQSEKTGSTPVGSAM
jgi:hypothetical protein